jgi:hypothetical protein
LRKVICSTIIEHIEQLGKTRQIGLGYYYFDFSDKEILKLDSFLRCLVWQLCIHAEQLPEPVRELRESHQDRRQASVQDLVKALFSLLRDPTRQDYIIIDALDECPIEIREQFYELFLDHIDQEAGCFNFLFTSRKEPDIEQRMTKLKRSNNMPILTGDVDADIRLHVSRSISTHRAMKTWSKELKAEIEDVISSGAQGV